MSHRWFSKHFKHKNSLDIGVSTVSQSRSPKSTFGGGNTNINIFRELPLIFSDSLKKKEEIEVLNCRVAYALNPSPQSHFSDTIVGCMDGLIYTQNIHAPTSTINVEIPDSTSDFDSISEIINVPMSVNAKVIAFDDHFSSGSVNGFSEPRFTAVISAVCENINRNAISPTIPVNTIFTLTFYFLLKRYLFCPSRAVQNKYLQKAEIPDKSEKSKKVRWNTLKKVFAGNLPRYQLRISLLFSESKQNQILQIKSLKSLYQHPPKFFLGFYFAFETMIACMRLLFLRFFIFKYNATNVTQKGGYPSIENALLMKLYAFSNWITSLPFTHFLELRKYPVLCNVSVGKVGWEF